MSGKRAAPSRWASRGAMYASVMGGGMFLFAVVGAWMLFAPHDVDPGPTSVDTSVDGTADPSDTPGGASDPASGATAGDEPSDDVSQGADGPQGQAVETVPPSPREAPTPTAHPRTTPPDPTPADPTPSDPAPSQPAPTPSHPGNGNGHGNGNGNGNGNGGDDDKGLTAEVSAMLAEASELDLR